MKCLRTVFILCFIFFHSMSYVVGQPYANDSVKQYSIKIPGNVSGWQLTEIAIKKGDLIFFKSTGKVKYGFWIGENYATGFDDRLLKQYNLPNFSTFNHGVLLCGSNKVIVPCISSSQLLDNYPAAIDALPQKLKNEIRVNNFAGNLFYAQDDQQLSFCINDKKATDNSGFFDVTVIVIQAKENLYSIKFYAYPPGTEVIKPDGTTHTSRSGHIYIGFFEKSELVLVRGFGPDGESYWKPSKLKKEDYLIRFAQITFETTVNEEMYNKAFSIRKNAYFIGVNDCVSYAAQVAKSIGLITPAFSSAIMQPMTYVEFLIQNN